MFLAIKETFILLYRYIDDVESKRIANFLGAKKMNSGETWKTLTNPPVVVALFQMKFSSANLKLSDFLQYDTQIKRKFPIRQDTIQVGLDLGRSQFPLGISKFSGTSDAKVGGYVYLTVNQKVRLELSENTITFVDESPYKGWAGFKKETLKSLMLVADLFSNIEIDRLSIRFINRFSFNTFDFPQEYFQTLISTSENSQLPYPLRQYGFKLVMDVPDSDIYTIVNQNVEYVNGNRYEYTFDIDVLDTQRLVYNKETLVQNLETLRNIKNKIFFDNLTQKTIDLCN